MLHNTFCRRLAALVLTLAVALSAALPGFAAYPMPVQTATETESVYLFNADTGKTILSQNADQQKYVASLTKLMTALLLVESGKDLNGEVTVPTDLTQEFKDIQNANGTTMGLRIGETVRRIDLLNAMLIISANDAASVIAWDVGGSVVGFVQQMNARAAELGMTNTTFRNACGLDTEGHLSTARDVAVLSRYLLNTCPELLHYTGIWTDSLRNGQTQLVNTNKLLRRYSGITGLKTGTTNGAGVCISASATRDGLTLIAVVLGSPSSADRFHSATTLLDYGFANYAAAPLPTLPERPLALAVKGSAEDSVPLDYAALPETILIEKGTASALRAELTLPEALEAPVEKGRTVGKVSIFQDDTLLNEYEVKAAADAPLLTFGGALELLWQCLLGA